MNGYTRHAQATASYRDALRTQTPAHQIVRLYDVAILRLKEAKDAILEQNPALRSFLADKDPRRSVVLRSLIVERRSKSAPRG